jgi:hypothetical protein
MKDTQSSIDIKRITESTEAREYSEQIPEIYKAAWNSHEGYGICYASEERLHEDFIHTFVASAGNSAYIAKKDKRAIGVALLSREHTEPLWYKAEGLSIRPAYQGEGIGLSLRERSLRDIKTQDNNDWSIGTGTNYVSTGSQYIWSEKLGLRPTALVPQIYNVTSDSSTTECRNITTGEILMMDSTQMEVVGDKRMKRALETLRLTVSATDKTSSLTGTEVTVQIDIDSNNGRADIYPYSAHSREKPENHTELDHIYRIPANEFTPKTIREKAGIKSEYTAVFYLQKDDTDMQALMENNDIGMPAGVFNKTVIYIQHSDDRDLPKVEIGKANMPSIQQKDATIHTIFTQVADLHRLWMEKYS